jgi:hypothetical protein
MADRIRNNNQLLSKNRFQRKSTALENLPSDRSYDSRARQFREEYSRRNDTLAFRSNPLAEAPTRDRAARPTVNELLDAQEGPENITRSRVRYLTVDSRDRDTSVYPTGSSYTVPIPNPFENVLEVRLEACSFPNSAQLIRDTPASIANNTIYWQNEGDNTIYNVSFPAGNYQASGLQNALQTAMNTIIREDTGSAHEFTVTVDTVANITTFTSLVTEQFSGPFSTTTGTSIIEVSHSNHGFSDGQVISISGTGQFAALNVALVNTDHSITVLDANTQSIRPYTLAHSQCLYFPPMNRYISPGLLAPVQMVS